MFRFEVHVRITEQTAANPADSFLFSKLFEGDGSGMVGGSGHIPNFCGEMGDPFAGTSAAEALLRCGLMDELVSRKEDNLFGPQSSWEVGFSSDWTVFGSGSGDPPEEQSSPWSSEEDQNPFEFDNEESQNLWDSLCGSSDPYNPFHFSACTSTRTKRGEEPGEGCDGTEEEVLGPGVNILVSRSDSETSWSSSGGSSLSEEAEDLLRFFTTSDPYDPMSFTACSSTSSPPAPPTADTTLLEEEEDEEQQLWESLNTHRDPFHPLNFQACLQSASAEVPPRGHQNPTRPSLHQRASTHRHPETTTVPWTRPRRSDKPTKQPGPAHKKVTQNYPRKPQLDQCDCWSRDQLLSQGTKSPADVV